MKQGEMIDWWRRKGPRTSSQTHELYRWNGLSFRRGKSEIFCTQGGCCGEIQASLECRRGGDAKRMRPCHF